jgi:hypothetical protein
LRFDTMRLAIGQEIAPRDLEERPQMPAARQGTAHRHRGEALDPGSAKELQQQCLRLILGVMRSQQAFARCEVQREGPIPGLARSSLQRLAGRLDRHLDHAERNLEPSAERDRGRA